MAVLRIALPWANIPATTALATVDAVAGQKEGLLAGGNVLMPGFTPRDTVNTTAFTTIKTAWIRQPHAWPSRPPGARIRSHRRWKARKSRRPPEEA